MKARYVVMALFLPASALAAGEEIHVGRNARGGLVATNVSAGSYAAPGQRKRLRTQALDSATPLTSRRIDELIREAARSHGLSPALVRAVTAVESNFNIRAVSPKGARGLMQLMPETARSLQVTDVYDPRQNLQAGSRHLRGLLDRYEGDVRLALAAYNAGEGAVQRYGGIPPYPETRRYVQRVLEEYEKARVLETKRNSVVPYRDHHGRVVFSNVPPAAVRGGKQ